MASSSATTPASHPLMTDSTPSSLGANLAHTAAPLHPLPLQIWPPLWHLPPFSPLLFALTFRAPYITHLALPLMPATSSTWSPASFGLLVSLSTCPQRAPTLMARRPALPPPSPDRVAPGIVNIFLPLRSLTSCPVASLLNPVSSAATFFFDGSVYLAFINFLLFCTEGTSASTISPVSVSPSPADPPAVSYRSPIDSVVSWPLVVPMVPPFSATFRFSFVCNFWDRISTHSCNQNTITWLAQFIGFLLILIHKYKNFFSAATYVFLRISIAPPFPPASDLKLSRIAPSPVTPVHPTSDYQFFPYSPRRTPS